MLLPGIVFLILDIIWITLFMNPRYQILVKNIQGSAIQFNPYYAISAYILMVVLLYRFVIKYDFSLWETFLFGFCVYGVYDMTCGALFKKWDLKLAIIDMIWGGFVYMCAQYISIWTRSYLGY